MRDTKEDSLKKKNFKWQDWIDTKNYIKKSWKYVKNNKKYQKLYYADFLNKVS